MKYIDVNKLKEKIYAEDTVSLAHGSLPEFDQGCHHAFLTVLSFIDSIQQEQPETSSNLVDVDAVREDFMTEVYRVLDADPTNDRANAIIYAFDSLPTVSQERPKVDIEKEIDAIWNPRFNLGWDEKSLLSINHSAFETIARHFFELGLNARK